MFEKLKIKAKELLNSLFVVPFLMGYMCMPVYASASPSEASLSDTLGIFSEVFAWFLEEGANLLAWMLDKPIILLSLSIFFVGAVVGVLARIYSSF